MTMTQPQLFPGPNKGDCEGNQDRCHTEGCPLFGTLGRPFRDGKHRVRGCGDPAARGKRNRRKGDEKAAKGRRILGLVGANSRHEEHWGGRLRTEFKAGAKANVVWTKFRGSEAQSETARPIGDIRPFVAVFAPDGMSEQLVVIRLSQLHDVACAVLEGDDDG